MCDDERLWLITIHNSGAEDHREHITPRGGVIRASIEDLILGYQVSVTGFGAVQQGKQSKTKLDIVNEPKPVAQTPSPVDQSASARLEKDTQSV